MELSLSKATGQLRSTSKPLNMYRNHSSTQNKNIPQKNQKHRSMERSLMWIVDALHRRVDVPGDSESPHASLRLLTYHLIVNSESIECPLYILVTCESRLCPLRVSLVFKLSRSLVFFFPLQDFAGTDRLLCFEKKNN